LSDGLTDGMSGAQFFEFVTAVRPRPRRTSSLCCPSVGGAGRPNGRRSYVRKFRARPLSKEPPGLARGVFEWSYGESNPIQNLRNTLCAAGECSVTVRYLPCSLCSTSAPRLADRHRPAGVAAPGDT
jgi:hypothetical protein